ncbi:hypothetical protein KP005_02775 [Geomonas nitrogeniifigens]|uniref:DGQHR domain-containing protein n=1 Tax=Geomonas diazotrophica TaxID=2843197 RepID=A0ABX8JKG1_9BACT|nr:hypothetical protein [Geomonas nitrogeniifigens]QWV98233.1 hypothetical protein KP005_02775 [Geomonas nitrogeniifigens]
MEFKYKAIQIKQTTSDKWLSLFASPATEISEWAGVPQKKRFGADVETAGFQREENPKRISELKEFYQNKENIIQNPLLCALRSIPLSSARFELDAGEDPSASVRFGTIVITIPNFGDFTFREIVGTVREYIEGRVPELGHKTPDESLVASLKMLASQAGHLEISSHAEEIDPDSLSEEDASPDTADNGDPSSVLFEESHIIDFWQEIAARHEVLKLIEGTVSGDDFLGFSKDALLSYLRPIVLVDGQHRLRGAIEAAKAKLNDASIQSEIEGRITNGDAPESIEAEILTREARTLPISLLMTDEAEEQVFQFIVVNQKATPIGRALLGTIVSTTLSNDEMEKVASRLKGAGIHLEESQAITYLARYPESPFCGLVERGMTGDAKDLLQWNVFSSLITIFRDLKGGKIFGQKNDYADIWRHKYMNSSNIVADFQDSGCETQYAFWRRLDGPWRSVFMQFWTKIRETFGNTEDPDKHNYWGRPRESNLFNKISLTILAADFFQFLVETRTTIDSLSEIPDLVDSWLENVNTGYFDKDWNLTGVKKDSSGIRNRWASMWVEYRKSGEQLPDRRLFRQPKGE